MGPDVCIFGNSSTKKPQGSENTVSMMEAGMIPNVVDYYDVDTDPTGQFVPRWHVNGEKLVAGVCLFFSAAGCGMNRNW